MKKSKFTKWFERQFGKWPNFRYKTYTEMREEFLRVQAEYNAVKVAMEQVETYCNAEIAARYAWEAKK